MYPTKCKRCGSSLSKPVDLATWKLKIESTRGASRDRVGIVCLNRECRHYQIFSLGVTLRDKPELDKEGNLEFAEYDIVVAAYASRLV